jgi:hypothetical protein
MRWISGYLATVIEGVAADVCCGGVGQRYQYYDWMGIEALGMSLFRLWFRECLPLISMMNPNIRCVLSEITTH